MATRLIETESTIGSASLTHVLGIGAVVGLFTVVAGLGGTLALLGGIVAVGVVLLAPPRGVLLTVLLVMQFGTSAEWLRLLNVGQVGFYAFDLVIVVAAIRMLGWRPAQRLDPAFHRRVGGLLVALIGWSIFVEVMSLGARGTDFFLASGVTFIRVLILEGLLVFLLMTRGIRSRGDARWLYTALLIIVLVQGLFALFQAYVAPVLGIGSGLVGAFSSPKFTEYYGTPSFRGVGFIGSGRELAGMINMVVFGWLALALTTRGKARRSAWVAVLILVFALLRTLSKFEYIAFAVAATWFAIRARRISWGVGVAALLLVAVFSMPESAVTGFQVEIEPTELSPEDTSVGRRMLIWQYRMLPLIGERPLLGHGWGVDALDTSGPALLRGTAHSQYLQWAAAIGILGALLYVALVWALFRRADQLLMSARSRDERVIGMGMTGAFITMAASSAYSDMFNPGTGTNRMFWLLAGILYAFLAIPREQQEAAVGGEGHAPVPPVRPRETRSPSPSAR